MGPRRGVSYRPRSFRSFRALMHNPRRAPFQWCSPLYWGFLLASAVSGVHSPPVQPRVVSHWPSVFPPTSPDRVPPACTFTPAHSPASTGWRTDAAPLMPPTYPAPLPPLCCTAGLAAGGTTVQTSPTPSTPPGPPPPPNTVASLPIVPIASPLASRVRCSLMLKVDTASPLDSPQRSLGVS